VVEKGLDIGRSGVASNGDRKRDGKRIYSRSEDRSADNGTVVKGRLLSTNAIIWLLVCVAVAASFFLAERFPIMLRIEEGAGIPIPDLLDFLMDGFVAVFKSPFRVFAAIMEVPIDGFRSLYLWLPWPFAILFAMYIGNAAAGRGMAAFCGMTVLYTLVMDNWSEAALTMAMISVSLPLSVSTGLLIGILSHRNPTLRTALGSLLDFMQTIPAFAYLIPLLILFGFGPTVGLIASAIYAIPPMARNVLLGLSRDRKSVV